MADVLRLWSELPDREANALILEHIGPNPPTPPEDQPTKLSTAKNEALPVSEKEKSDA